MKKIFLLISIIILMTSCVSSKEFQVPMTEKMYQESKLEAKLIRKSKKKNFLKNYTKNFVNSIPDEDLKLMTKDTIIVVYDITTVR